MTVSGSKFHPTRLCQAGRLAGKQLEEGAGPVDPFLKLVTFMLLDPRTWFISQWVHPRLWASSLLEGFRAQGPIMKVPRQPYDRVEILDTERVPILGPATSPVPPVGFICRRRSSAPYTVVAFDSCNLARPIVCRNDPPESGSNRDAATTTRVLMSCQQLREMPRCYQTVRPYRCDGMGINYRCIFPGPFSMDLYRMRSCSTTAHHDVPRSGRQRCADRHEG